ncbi:hypothetical protein [Lysinibacillus piscis]|uniref:Uncharacterized protein n=1 Tax=Lysinibacillus piscis TaxID=2518931 RepID=A0ABQ5NH77_9BACI|nr:hypothetical protein [Lysinibacillus sp. KH24]GLC87716.1 hypothetical protein LYSBPC_08430 [Lysinibacillus sp. KH24]
MNKFKMISLSLVAVISVGVSANVSSVQAAENLTPEVSVASDTFWYYTTVAYTTTQSMWVSVAHNGKMYSGYIYNRGFAPGNTGESFFSGTLRVGPYAPSAMIGQE